MEVLPLHVLHVPGGLWQAWLRRQGWGRGVRDEGGPLRAALPTLAVPNEILLLWGMGGYVLEGASFQMESSGLISDS